MKNTSAEQKIYDLEKRYWQAIKDNDNDTILSLTDDPCIVTGANGIMKFNKKEYIEMMKAPQNYKLQNFEFSNDYQVSLLDENTAVIAYNVKESLEVGGKPINLELAESSTWRRRNGKWVCCLHSEAIFGDPLGRDRIHLKKIS